MIVTGTKAINQPMGFLNYLPGDIRRMCQSLMFDQVQEIRLRLGKPLCVFMDGAHWYITENARPIRYAEGAYLVKKSDIDDAVSLISRFSVYAFEEEIAQGFITITGGHRVGLCGKIAETNGKISCMKEISGLNYRFAKQIIGCGEAVVGAIEKSGTVKNTLIVSPPQCGKTTMLRDIVRSLSHKGYKVLVVDERSEIASMSGGISSYDLGDHTDVLDACAKTDGMLMGLRSMSPQVIVTDEIGTSNDVETIKKAACCGVAIITTIHAQSRADLENRPDLQGLRELFDCIVTLSNRDGCGTIEEIYIKP